jgi:hypothetical protein
MISTGKRRRLNMDRLLSQSFQTMPSQLMQQSHRISTGPQGIEAQL